MWLRLPEQLHVVLYKNTTHHSPWHVLVVCVLSLPAVSGVEQHSVFLPCDPGFRYSTDLTLESSDSSLVHRHRCRVCVELRESWEPITKRTTVHTNVELLYKVCGRVSRTCVDRLWNMIYLWCFSLSYCNTDMQCVCWPCSFGAHTQPCWAALKWP